MIILISEGDKLSDIKIFLTELQMSEWEEILDENRWRKCLWNRS